MEADESYFIQYNLIHPKKLYDSQKCEGNLVFKGFYLVRHVSIEIKVMLYGLIIHIYSLGIISDMKKASFKQF